MLLTLKNWLSAFETEPADPLYEFKLSGENKYLELAIDKYNHDLYHFLLTQSDSELAKDVCQKTWLTVVEKRQAYHTSQAPKAFLFKVARNALIDELRRQKKLAYMESPEQHIPAQTEREKQSHQPLYNAILSLPLAQREAISLQLEGFSLQQIASITDSAQETIKTRLRYARAALKNKLGADDE
ncbi:RNA polymerase sigma factor [Pseudoalteromonas rubra]|uniref:RNA polymerase sigma factor n=1 Tax=Pseudoalteromonas rubra TaxID=43658 RepID=A0A5S3WFR2_9GAMM|nr:sigma-70 family RNA polymerase sigma factor [Pseudoalteromonas rubra]TMP25106.1 RNA polymerase sigma factor [Pseudoalteromonas rubra]TMP28362.1 RNA polymerase sigma factor [Pseudoalteromonas rubra]